MSIMTADVNQTFDTERAGQISEIQKYNADTQAWNALSEAERVAIAQTEAQRRFADRLAEGKMKDLGNGRYQVTDPGSWDNGEVLFTQQAATGDRALLVLPETGLDTSTGQEALFSMFPEWHGKGNIRVAGERDISKVIKLAGLDFTVMQRPAEFSVGSQRFTVPGSFVNYRSDNLHPFGVVGKIYEPFQPASSFDFLAGLVETDELMVAAAGAFGQGEKIFITCLLPDHMAIDVQGVNDIIAPYVALLDTFDGSGRFWAMMTMWRIRCRNTERLAVNGALSRWGVRHTTNGQAKVKEAQRMLGLSRKYLDVFKAEEEALARTSLAVDEFREVMAESFAAVASKDSPSGRVFGDRDHEAEGLAKTSRTRLANNRREDSLMELWARYSDQLGATGYAAERVVTDYADHELTRRAAGEDQAERDAVRKARRLEANLGGSSDDLKDAGHTALMRRAGERKLLVQR